MLIIRQRIHCSPSAACCGYSAALLVNHPSAHVRAEYHPQSLLTTVHDWLILFLSVKKKNERILHVSALPPFMDDRSMATTSF